MKHTLAGSLFFSLLVSFTAFADGQQGQAKSQGSMRQMDQAAMKAMPLTDGVVKKADLKNGKITLQHGAIVNVMPAMTMSYRVKQSKQLESIHVGDKVRFAVEMLNDDYVVTHIEVAK